MKTMWEWLGALVMIAIIACMTIGVAMLGYTNTIANRDSVENCAATCTSQCTTRCQAHCE